MDRVMRAAVVALIAGLAWAPAAPAAKPKVQPGTVIVKYADSSSAASRLLAGKSAGVLETIGRLTAVGAHVVRVAGDPAAVAARLNRSSSVLYAEPDYIYRATGIPNDPRFGELYGLNNTGQSGGLADADIDAPEGWNRAFGTNVFPTALNGVKIGIVDTGVQANHPDLSGKVVNCGGVRSFGLLGLFADPTIVNGKCADDNGHGTHVTGTAAAYANNGAGVAGVAFNSPVAVCKALDRNGAGPISGVANCIAFLVSSGARVISMSLSGPASTTLQNAVAAAGANALLVAAAGNTGDSQLNYPAAYPQVVSVAAVDRRGARAPFSTFNSDVEFAAPGVDVTSTWLSNGYSTISGTSMATPHVAGVAAIVAARVAGGPAAWREKLKTSVDDLAPDGRDPQTGFGRINLDKATS